MTHLVLAECPGKSTDEKSSSSCNFGRPAKVKKHECLPSKEIYPKVEDGDVVG
jgi:hypothetical protein